MACPRILPAVVAFCCVAVLWGSAMACPLPLHREFSRVHDLISVDFQVVIILAPGATWSGGWCWVYQRTYPYFVRTAELVSCQPVAGSVLRTCSFSIIPTGSWYEIYTILLYRLLLGTFFFFFSTGLSGFSLLPLAFVVCGALKQSREDLQEDTLATTPRPPTDQH